jgi:protein-tyrosine phosphatase
MMSLKQSQPPTTITEINNYTRSENLIDIHSHILWGMDDGAKTVDDSLMMAKAAINSDITQVIATPHHLNNHFVNPKNKVIKKVQEFNRILEEKGFKLEVLAGQEIRIHGELCEDLSKRELLTLTESSNYVLIELPTSSVPHYTRKLLYQLLIDGFSPIIAHPERNLAIQRDPNIMYEFVRDGVLSQVTAGSFMGIFGKKAKAVSFDLLEHNLAHVLASDAHNDAKRGFVLNEAYRKISKDFGESLTSNLKENANSIIRNTSIYSDVPMEIKKKSSIFFPFSMRR